MRIAAAGVFFDCHPDHAALFEASNMCAVFRHSGVAASMHPLRHRRQHASIAASPPACTPITRPLRRMCSGSAKSCMHIPISFVGSAALPLWAALPLCGLIIAEFH